MFWITIGVWVVIYLLVGWVISRDEKLPVRLIYIVIWGILPVMAKQSRSLAKHLKPNKTKLDETDEEEDVRLWKEANRPSW